MVFKDEEMSAAGDVYVGIGLTGLSSKYFRVWLDTELLDPIVFHCIGKYIL